MRPRYFSKHLARALIGALSGTALAAGLAFGTAAAPEAERLGDIDHIYDIYLGGLWVAEMTVTAEIANDHYEADAVLRTKGLIGALYKASFEVEAEGAVAAETGYYPARFTANSRNSKKSQFVEMRYEAGRPSTLTAEPEFQPKPWEVDPTAQADAADPLSAALGVLANQPAESLCNRKVEIFDGRKRYAIVLGEPEERADGIKCPATYQRLAGYKPKFMAKPDIPFAFWFEAGPNGSYHVQKAMGETPVGTAVIRRRPAE
ncbi:MAG: DUF3108 domain-containing protein [Pseudomonadota bacterium]